MIASEVDIRELIMKAHKLLYHIQFSNQSLGALFLLEKLKKHMWRSFIFSKVSNRKTISFLYLTLYRSTKTGTHLN